MQTDVACLDLKFKFLEIKTLELSIAVSHLLQLSFAWKTSNILILTSHNSSGNIRWKYKVHM